MSNASDAGSLFWIIRLAIKGVLNASNTIKLKVDKKRADLRPLNASRSIRHANKPNRGSGISKPPIIFLITNIRVKRCRVNYSDITYYIDDYRPLFSLHVFKK